MENNKSRVYCFRAVRSYHRSRGSAPKTRSSVPRTITEMVPVNQEYGTIALSYRPSSPVTLKDGYRVVTILPPNAPCITGEGGCPEVCCFCWLHATYTVGEDLGCDGVPPRFVQAVAQLFAYIVENRGDTAMQPYLLYQSGAHAFLAPEVTYVL